MKNFIIFAVLAALLGGCAGKKDQNGIADSEDIVMLSFEIFPPDTEPITENSIKMAKC